MKRIAIVATAGALDLDTDGAYLFPALERAGIRSEVVSWRDPEIRWAEFDLAVIRATWDYVANYQEFRSWLSAASRATTLLNPAAVVAWNTDKIYLSELSEAGLAVVPTAFLQPGESPESRQAALLGEGPWVVKPRVSAGCYETERYEASERSAALAHVDRLLAAGVEVMVQPYQTQVEAQGEAGLVYLEGRFSHAFRKGALLAKDATPVPGAAEQTLFRKEAIDPLEPTPAQLELGQRVMDWVAERWEPLLYARVDLVPDPEGQPRLLELELAEPSLFHETDPSSADRLAAAIKARLG
jgi:glutathione synthase/RimK-type ligase-like ATP-grasp enzyme